MKYFIYIFVILMFSASSCGLQNRMFATEQTLLIAKQKAEQERNNLYAAQQTITEKLNNGETDSILKDNVDEVLSTLNANLDTIQKRIAMLETFLKNKSNFSDSKYYIRVAPYVKNLDSFSLMNQKRELIYQLVIESINTKAFNLFKLGAFFEPGVYNIPLSEQPHIATMFSPVLDSITLFANKYGSVPKVVRLVFVGYADESPIMPEGTLYKQLSRFSNQSDPSREELNRVLSQLRANEMMRNMKLVIGNEINDFNEINKLRFNYFNYGRGELLPSSKITDYKKDDERRRIVMFYWSVLPQLNYLK
jgi:hypothetical protein